MIDAAIVRIDVIPHKALAWKQEDESVQTTCVGNVRNVLLYLWYKSIYNQYISFLFSYYHSQMVAKKKPVKKVVKKAPAKKPAAKKPAKKGCCCKCKK